MTGRKTVLLCGVVALLLCSACTKEEGQGNLLSVNYSFKWERAYWDIRNGVIGQAFYNGPKLGTAWDMSINKTSGKSILFATVHLAAMKFYYGNCLGVHRPVLADSKTKIAVKDEDASWGAGCCWGTWSHQGVIPDIIIALPRETSSHIVFHTTIHELAHQSHLLFMNLGTYIQLGKEIHESWAEAVAYEFTKQHYLEERHLISSGLNTFDYRSQQGWYPGSVNGKSSCYTPLFIDLIDSINQRITHGQSSYSYPNDNISGYTLQYIQNNILPSSHGLSSCYNSVKSHKINGVTDHDVNNLFELYWGYEYVRPHLQ